VRLTCVDVPPVDGRASRRQGVEGSPPVFRRPRVPELERLQLWASRVREGVEKKELSHSKNRAPSRETRERKSLHALIDGPNGKFGSRLYESSAMCVGDIHNAEMEENREMRIPDSSDTRESPFSIMFRGRLKFSLLSQPILPTIRHDEFSGLRHADVSYRAYI
jgi:hypothetical protein